MKKLIQLVFFCASIAANENTQAQNTIRSTLPTPVNYTYSSNSCDDQEKNGDEVNIDCGGPECAPCGSFGIPDDNLRTSVVVYPNPSRGSFKFQSNVGDIESIELFSQSGQILFTSGYIDRKEANIDLSLLNPQTVLARIKVNGRIIQKILVKQ